MTIAKGQSFPDGTYIYTCALCGGAGFVGANEDCPHCYGLDTAKIVEAMGGGAARGERYYALLKAFLSVNGKAIVDEVKRIKREQGKVTPADIGYVALKFKLNLKATTEWLEEVQIVPSGMYEHLMANVKVKDIYTAAREKYPELEQT